MAPRAPCRKRTSLLCRVVVPACLTDRPPRRRIPGEQRRFVNAEAGHALAAVMLRQRQDRLGRQIAGTLLPTLLRIDVARLSDGERLTAFSGRLHRLADRRPRTVAA